MFRKKYAKVLIDQMCVIFEQWNAQPEVTEREIYSFLHRIKGTAGTIGLDELSDISASLLKEISPDGIKLWRSNEWAFHLKPLIERLDQEKKQIDGRIDEEEAFKQKLTSLSAASLLSAVDQGESESRIILIIDPNLEFASKLKDHLETEGYVVLISLVMDKGMEMFYRTRPSFVMCDFNLAMELDERVLRSFVSVLRKSVVPITFTGYRAGSSYEVKAYELGASGYLVKPLELTHFTAYLKNRFLWQRDIERITTIDELTGAYNRKYMNAVLNQRTEQYRHQGQIFSVVMIDIDYFKLVNDKYGHLTGDGVLKRLVSVCNSLLHEADRVFRFGGEEFVLILNNAGDQEAFEIVERMRIAFSQEVFESEDKRKKFQSTFSAGIATISSEDQTKEDLLEKADQALYQSKGDGRNRVTLYCERNEESESRILHVIIIDDDKFVRSILEKGFNTWEHHDHLDVKVHTYADGEAFLNSDWYYPQDQYVILLDGMMPKMDGIEVLIKIRSDYPDKNIVVSMLSARSNEENIVLALEKGADDYLFKPFNILEVIARIDRLAQRMLL